MILIDFALISSFCAKTIHCSKGEIVSITRPYYGDIDSVVASAIQLLSTFLSMLVQPFQVLASMLYIALNQ